jgi:lysyl endopeptidase
MVRRLPLVLALGLLLTRLAGAVEIDTVLLPDTKAAPVPSLRLADAVSLQPLAVLKPASEGAGDQLEALTAWNRSSRSVPWKNGLSRPLPLPKSVRFTADLLKSLPSRLDGGALLVPPSGGVVWAAEARVENSYRLRLHLSGVSLPEGTRIWVYGDDPGEEASVLAEDVTFQNEIWTPSVAGPAIRLEVRLPEAGLDGARFTVDRVLELVKLDATGAPQLDRTVTPKEDLSCIKDAACYGTAQLPTLEVQKRAVARLEFVDGSSSYICSGTLLNDTDETTNIPYLLTANHCFSTQASASTLEAFFDFIDPSCNGAAPTLGSRPRAVGATLLATGAAGTASDFTFVRLANLPAGRALLGSTSEPVTNGTVIHRLAHPLDEPMRYSVHTVKTSGTTCSGLPRSRFLYSVATLGGTFGGSSGSAAVRASDGRVVGQLLGSCGFNPEEGCDRSNDDVDGAFSQTWASVSAWLAPPVTTPGTCTPGPNTLCLQADRFKVEGTYQTRDGQSGPAKVVELTDETGYFWFFTQTNVEAVIKVLNACGATRPMFWVFAGGLTDVRVTITVTDVKTGAVKTYTNPLSTKFQPIQDTSAFATCP